MNNINNKLSIILPYVNEDPQILFTITNLRCELEQSDIDWQIIAVANKSTDKGYTKICNISSDRIKSLQYDEKLSHWNAKNFGIDNATGDIFLFIDSHCIVSKNAIVEQFKYYVENLEELNGTLHLPILYMGELAGRELEYKLQANITDKKVLEDGNVKNGPCNLHYSFTRYRHKSPYHRVSCMSTCGMMITRDLLVDKLGTWPSELGIYGGGENFINFTLAVMGYHINVFHRPYAVHHYAEKRGYNWNYDNWVRNRIIAAYMYGGEEWARIHALNIRGRAEVLEKIHQDVVKTCCDHRERVKPFIKMTPAEWVEREYAEGRFQGVYK